MVDLSCQWIRRFNAIDDWSLYTNKKKTTGPTLKRIKMKRKSAHKRKKDLLYMFKFRSLCLYILQVCINNLFIFNKC